MRNVRQFGRPEHANRLGRIIGGPNCWLWHRSGRSVQACAQPVLNPYSAPAPKCARTPCSLNADLARRIVALAVQSELGKGNVRRVGRAHRRVDQVAEQRLAHMQRIDPDPRRVIMTAAIPLAARRVADQNEAFPACPLRNVEAGGRGDRHVGQALCERMHVRVHLGEGENHPAPEPANHRAFAALACDHQLPLRRAP
eukprot:7092840-Prymnesium_polylepis.1